jgi:hypothetical protein
MPTTSKTFRSWLSGISKKKSKKSTYTVEVPDTTRSMSDPVGLDSNAVVWKQMYEQLLSQVTDARTEAACAHAVARNKLRIPEAEWTSLVAAQKQSLLGASAPQPLLLTLAGRRPPPPPLNSDSDDDESPPPPTSTKSNDKPKKKREPQARSAANHYCHFFSPIMRERGVPTSGKEGCMALAMKQFGALGAEYKEPFTAMRTAEIESMKSTGNKLTEEQLCELCPEGILSDYTAAKKTLAANAAANAAAAAPAATADGMDDEAEEDEE